MATIRPISDLRNHADQVSDICHREGEPVFITKNGKSDMVVLSQALYDRTQALLELYRKLDEADRESPAHGSSHDAVMGRLRKRLRR